VSRPQSIVIEAIGRSWAKGERSPSERLAQQAGIKNLRRLVSGGVEDIILASFSENAENEASRRG